MEQFRTIRGNILKMQKADDKKHAGEYLYTFTLHEQKSAGENITILLSRERLTDPRYYIAKFIREF